MQDLNLVGADPAADVVGVSVLGAGQNDVAVGDEVVILILLKDKAGGGADRGGSSR